MKNKFHLPLKSCLVTNSAEETFRFAEKLAKRLVPGSVVALTGEIGSGKTVFIKGLAHGLGIKDRDEVKSPTFVLMHIYQGKFPIYHFDLYRLTNENDLDAIGFDEFASDPKSISFIEWADHAPNWIPKEAIWIHLEVTGPHSRKIYENNSGN